MKKQETKYIVINEHTTDYFGPAPFYEIESYIEECDPQTDLGEIHIYKIDKEVNFRMNRKLELLLTTRSANVININRAVAEEAFEAFNRNVAENKGENPFCAANL